MGAEHIREGATVEEILEAAAIEFGVSASELDYDVLDEGARKRFGIGSDRPARVSIVVEGDDPVVEHARDLAREVLEIAPEPKTAHIDQRDGDDDERELTDEELDSVADTAISTLRELLAFFDAGEATIEEYEGDEGEIILDVVGEDLAVLIGRHGRTLESLQTLVSAITHKKLGFRYPVVVDIEGYRHRRRQKIDTMARSAADRAIRQRTVVRLRPMSPYERRLVHVALRDDKRIATESEGADPNRYVVIKPVRR